MTKREILEEARKLAGPFGFCVEFVKSAMARGVQGDEPTYTKVLELTGRSYGSIDPKILSDIVTKISNRVPINKVVVHIFLKGDPETSFKGRIENLDDSIIKNIEQGINLLFQAVLPSTKPGVSTINIIQSTGIRKVFNRDVLRGVIVIGYINADSRHEARHRKILMLFRPTAPSRAVYRIYG